MKQKNYTLQCTFCYVSNKWCRKELGLWPRSTQKTIVNKRCYRVNIRGFNPILTELPRLETLNVPFNELLHVWPLPLKNAKRTENRKIADNKAFSFRFGV